MGRHKTSGPVEKIVSAGILTVIAMIGTGILLYQREISPANQSLKPFAKEGPAEPQLKVQPSAGLRMPSLAGLVTLTSEERFDKDTLSEKINGKAELYLSAGFRSLVTQRFALEASPDDWFELFLYDMGEARNAFAVFSLQRREGALYSAEDPLAYRTANALFVAHGPWYLEMVGSRPSVPMLASMETLARALVRENPRASDTDSLSELSLFPSDNLDAKSLSLLPANAFGFEALDQVFVARYSIGGKEVAAFLSRRKDPAEARDLASRYEAFLVENGGQPLSSQAAPRELRMIEILGTTVVIFTRGEYLAGVSEAPDRDSALKTASSLFDRLGKATR
jgi:hypothetical protein